MIDRLTVYACWEQARHEYPDDPIRRKGRYVELMREQHHVVERKSDEIGNLRYGCPGRR